VTFRVKYQIGSETPLDNNSCIEQFSNFSYLGSSISCNCDEDLNKEVNKFQSICGVIPKTLKEKPRKETNLKFFKFIAVPVLLYV
jgi:hypothetical protein